MPLEIERKFLVINDQWKRQGESEEIRQGYLAREPHCVVRVRVSAGKGWLTVKSRVVGITRSEYEVEVPYADALEMLDNLCPKPLMEKRRTRIPAGNVLWEVDEYSGENQGLVVAEVELDNADQVIELPEWIGQEVTGDPRYYNSNLLLNPFQSWSK